MPPVMSEDQHDQLYMDQELLNVRYNRLSRAVQHFVKRWSKDYLIALKEKHYGNCKAQQTRPICVDEIVLVATDSPKARWPLGCITKLFPDPDHIVRTVEVFFQGHHSICTLDKLYPLELAPVPVTPEPVSSTSATENLDPGMDLEVATPRPRRAASQTANTYCCALIEHDLL